jgi:hypothetical protein
MTSPSNLVTMAQVKAWLSLPATSADDAALGMLISQISRNIISYINRASILPKPFAETRDGNGKTAMMLRNYPVIGMVSLTVDGVAIAASPAPSGGVVAANGYILEVADPEPPGNSQSVFLLGSCFNRGTQNVVHAYNAGYQVSAEPMIAGAVVTAQQPYGAWGSDIGVKNAGTGVALAKVMGVPATGQYALSTTVVGGYVFAAADAGVNMLISYGYIPFDLAEAALEWIGERYAYRARIGIASKSLGGQETTSFAISKMPAFIAAILQQYTRVATF